MDNISDAMGRYIKPNNENPATRASQRSTNQSGRGSHRRHEPSCSGAGVWRRSSREEWLAGGSPDHLNHASTRHGAIRGWNCLRCYPPLTHWAWAGTDEMKNGCSPPPPTWTRCQPRPATRRTGRTTGLVGVRVVHRTWRPTCGALPRRAP